MSEFSYKSRGAPLEAYELTRSDHHRQRVSEHIHEDVQRMAAEWRVEEAADPALREARNVKVAEVVTQFLSTPVPASQLMRWRVRLYCGHIVETRRHRTVDEPTRHGSSSMACPECGKDPSSIVAYEPIGLADPRPVPPVSAPRPTRAQLEQRIHDLEAELTSVRASTQPGRAPLDDDLLRASTPPDQDN